MFFTIACHPLWYKPFRSIQYHQYRNTIRSFQHSWNRTSTTIFTITSWYVLLSFHTFRPYHTIQAMTMNSMNALQSKKIAIGQLCSTSSKWDNLMNVAICASWTQQHKCCMLFLPECFGFMGLNAEETIRAAEQPYSIEDNAQRYNPPGVTDALLNIIHNTQQMSYNVVPNNIPSIHDYTDINDWEISLIDGLRVIAKSCNIWISGGSIHMAVVNDDDMDQPRKIENTHIIIDNTGTIRTKYAKIHLFDVCIPGKVNLQESKTTRAGTELVVCPDSPIGCLGISICYDLRFPEMYTQLVQKMGAQILLVPSAFTVPTGHAHWHTLLRARAIENQCYVIAAAQYGQHNEKRESYGHSLVVDGWGTILVDGGGMDSSDKPSYQQPSIHICDIDVTTLSTIRERMPIQQHRDNSQF